MEVHVQEPPTRYCSPDSRDGDFPDRTQDTEEESDTHSRSRERPNDRIEIIKVRMTIPVLETVPEGQPVVPVSWVGRSVEI